MRKWLGMAALGVALAMGSGCLVSFNSHETRSGKYVSDTTLAQMQPGTTTEWASKVIGEPSSKETLSDGTELWRWTYSESRDRKGTIFLLFGSNDRKEVNGTVFAEFKKGVLTRWWRG